MDLTVDHSLRVIGYGVFPEPRQLRDIREHSTYAGFIGTGTDHIPVSPFTEDRGDGIDHDRLTGTGLTGQNIEAPVKSDVRAFDHSDILDMK
jgi:hypothetical protein